MIRYDQKDTGVLLALCSLLQIHRRLCSIIVSQKGQYIMINSYKPTMSHSKNQKDNILWTKKQLIFSNSTDRQLSQANVNNVTTIRHTKNRNQKDDMLWTKKQLILIKLNKKQLICTPSQVEESQQHTLFFLANCIVPPYISWLSLKWSHRQRTCLLKIKCWFCIDNRIIIPFHSWKRIKKSKAIFNEWVNMISELRYK